MAAITLTVNGQVHSLEVDSEMPLLWVLRDLLGLTGTKFGCGNGICGACNVHRDGKLIHSCITEIGEVNDSSITTIEGLHDGEGNLHPLQKAWLIEKVPQCGYCQPGQLMAAMALLNNNPNPSDEDIDRVMKNTLCRCGTYQRIRRAIHRVAEEGGA